MPELEPPLALFLFDVRKPELVSGLSIEGEFIRTNLVILTGHIARDFKARETKGGISVTGSAVVTDRPARDKDGKTYKDENSYGAKDSEFQRVTCFNFTV